MPSNRGARPSFASSAGQLSRTLAAGSGLLALALGASLWLASPGHAQDARIIQPGSMAVTGFSGTWIPGFDEGLPPGVDPVEETFIDTSRAPLRVFDVSVLGAPSGQVVYTPQPFEVLASQIGQVFGLAYDDGVRDGEPSGVPDLYAAATSLHGIRIVTVAPGAFDTPIYDTVPPEVKAGLEAQMLFPRRLGKPEEFAMFAGEIIRNPMHNGRTYRFDAGVILNP